MLEKLTAAGERIADAAIARQIETFSAIPLPPGIDIASSTQGIVLTGKRLRRRYITDPELRNFAR